MVRDAARALGKEVKLEILRETTEVDREILERVESPLGHLLRNTPSITASRVTGGTSPCWQDRRRRNYKLEAPAQRRNALIDVADDGRGIRLEALRFRRWCGKA